MDTKLQTNKKIIIGATINKKTQKIDNFHESNVEMHNLNEEHEKKN